MSWDYSFFNQTSANTNNHNANISSFKNNHANLQLNAQLPQNTAPPSVNSFNNGSISSISSTESVNNNMGTFDFASESDMEAKLLPSNFWYNQNNTSVQNKGSNTLEEAQFLQNQLSNGDSWYSTNSNQSSHSQSQQSQAHLLNQYTTSSTPISTTSTPSTFNPLSVNMALQNSQSSQPQFQQQHTQSAQGVNHLLNNTQSLLQSYQQQQVYLEGLQQQQQQMLQNPLFLQQQAQMVSQQLQQLQLQLQLQQQQIESTTQLLNSQSKLSLNDNLPSLTQENLTKLSLDSTKNEISSNPDSISNNSQNDKSQSVNTELYKTELCSTFAKNGACPYGSKCQFAHGSNELKAVDRGNKWRSKPCANWSKTGSCRYGSRCCFRHGE